MDQALLPVLAVRKEDLNPLLLPKQVERLCPWCPKSGCPPISAMRSFQKLHGWNQLVNMVKMLYNMTFLAQKLIHLLLRLGVLGKVCIFFYCEQQLWYWNLILALISWDLNLQSLKMNGQIFFNLLLVTNLE